VLWPVAHRSGQRRRLPAVQARHHYLRKPIEVAELVARYGGPDLANFEEC